MKKGEGQMGIQRRREAGTAIEYEKQEQRLVASQAVINVTIATDSLYGDVIHTVGPIAQGGVGEEERRALRSCYKNSLQTATEKAARSVAFPCISTGIYGYPPEQAVHEALATVREYLDAHHDKLDRVIFCVFLPADKKLYLQNLPLYFPAEATVKSKL
ncbi:O-acetyl-ADP-ribose deacetylase MACROD2 [Oryzias melastigma]|uniref:O-acetyl-ADP-ribose deacetylase MACROD2 n=1 Tax=Oryzias melastigma TaxID=30732 RepID=A0A834FA29_ORYME|nr:O-acetyl-ADP-ribose deacetylase MACROD2 [Oryzias melastigma]